MGAKTAELDAVLKSPEVDEFSRRIGRELIDLFRLYQNNALVKDLPVIGGYTFEKNPLGRLLIFPRMPDDFVTCLNVLIRENGISGRVLQKKNYTYYDRCVPTGVESPAVTKSRRRNRH